MRLLPGRKPKPNGIEPEEGQPSVTSAEKAELAAVKQVHSHTMDRADQAIRYAMDQAGKGAFGKQAQRRARGHS